MTATDPHHDKAQENLAGMMTALQNDLARSESKASLLLALTGAALVAIGSTASNLHVTVPALVPGLLGAACLAVATVLLLLAVRPNLGGSGWPTWHRLTGDQLLERLAAGYQMDQVRFLATLATRKFRLIRVAIDCVLAGLGLLALSAILSATS